MLLLCLAALLTAAGLLAWRVLFPAKPPVALPVLVLDARTCAPDTVVDLQHEAESGGLQDTRLGPGALRRVRCVGVPDVNHVILESETGRETVRLEGLGGPDRRLPEDVNAYLRGEGRSALAGLLMGEQTELLELVGPSDAVNVYDTGPEHGDAQGCRITHLMVRRRFGADLDVNIHALHQGWTYLADAASDLLIFGAETLFISWTGEFRTERGVFALAGMRELRRRWEGAAATVQSMTDSDLQAQGERVQDAIAGFLHWTPSRSLRFLWLDRAEAVDRLVEQAESRRRAWIERYPDWPDSRDQALRQADFDELVARDVMQSLALSPPGPEIWVVREATLSPALLEHALAHELVHEYQEEVLGFDVLDYPYAYVTTRAADLDGACEVIASEWTRSRMAGSEDFHGIDRPRMVRMFEDLARHHHLTNQEFCDGLSSDLQGGAAITASAADWLFAREHDATGGELRFQCVGGPGEAFVVEISNPGSEPFRGFFSGMWKFQGPVDASIFVLPEDEEMRQKILEGSYSCPAGFSPPFQLLLPAGGAVRVTVRINGGGGPIHLDRALASYHRCWKD